MNVSKEITSTLAISRTSQLLYKQMDRQEKTKSAGDFTASKSDSVSALASQRRGQISFNGFQFGQQAKMRDCRVGMGIRIFNVSS